ncbi:MAG: PucR family transcriptional regulator [Anaerolineae bacterium]
MLTVCQALELPVFSSASLVAGRAGLDSQIHWVHIVDIPEAHYEWKRRGVLLLTAGLGLRENAKRQAALIPKLVEQGFAGMVLCVGYYFDSTPHEIKQAADALGFPIIETPPDLLFIEITEAILERIVNQQFVLLQQSNQIFAQLTELVLQGANLEELASRLAGLLKRSITIEDPAFRILAAAQHGAVDEARQRSVANGRTTPKVAQHLLDAGIYAQLLERMGPLRVPPIPELDMIMERFVAPIIVGREIHGYIWIIAGDHPLTDLDELAISHGATVAALILFKDQAVHQAEETLRGDFLERLLRGANDSDAFSEQAVQLNYHPARPHQVLLIYAPLKMGGDPVFLQKSVGDWLQAQEIVSLMTWREEQLVVVLESDADEVGKQIAAALADEFNHPGQQLLIGVGKTYQSLEGSASHVRRSYEEARESLHIGLTLGQSEGVITFNELGVLHWLYHLPPEKRAGNIYLEWIYTLNLYDVRRGTKLIQTLETYLDHGGSLVETSQALFIHRNTLLHRLKHIEELCSVNLRDPLHRLNLHAAVKSYRLHPG